MGSKVIRISDLSLNKLNSIRYPKESYNSCLYRLLVSIPAPDALKESDEVEITPERNSMREKGE